MFVIVEQLYGSQGKEKENAKESRKPKYIAFVQGKGMGE
jgi:hypothetical protein